MYNFSDSLSSEEIEENLYWQYFCGYNYADHDIKISEASIRRFRNMLGDEGYNMILQELAKVGLKVGAYKKKDLDSVIICATNFILADARRSSLPVWWRTNLHTNLLF